MGEVILGMPGPWADDYHEASDHYTTKFGGLPDWPIPNIIVKPDLLECRSCGTNLLLVAQIYAPVSSKTLTIEERQIFVFGCISATCGSTPESWVVLRVQRCISSQVSKTHNHMGALLPEPSHAALNTDWQEDFWSFDKGEENDDDIDLEELGRALSEAASLASHSKKESIPHQLEATLEPSSTSQRIRDVDSNTPVLPCFYVYTQKEALEKEVASVCLNYTSLSIKENQTYLDENAPQEAWEEEGYEYDRALSADRTYLKFKKRMDAYPEQCFRYSYNGKPLLAAQEAGDPERCRLCGGSRHYEMQLMSPLLYFLQEATSDQKYSLENWNWMTLLLYTCSNSCSNSLEVNSNDEDWVVAEEALVLQGE